MKTKNQRDAKKKARCFGPEAEAVRRMGCIFEGKGDHACNYAQREVEGVRELYSDPAHVRSVGAGGTRFELVPMCRKAHTVQHAVGIKTVADLYKLDLWKLADEIALAHDRPLGLRGLADLWRREQRGPINGYDLDALGRFVRRELGRELKRRTEFEIGASRGARVVLGRVLPTRSDLAVYMCELLGGAWLPWSKGQSLEDARDLCEWAGWPS